MKEYQDWTPVVIKGTSLKSTAKPSTSSSFLTQHDAKMRKLDNDEELSEKQTSVSVRQQIQKRRVELGLTQKQLATRMNEQEQLIKEIENGKLTHPSQEIVSKLKRILNIRFTLK